MPGRPAHCNDGDLRVRRSLWNIGKVPPFHPHYANTVVHYAGVADGVIQRTPLVNAHPCLVGFKIVCVQKQTSLVATANIKLLGDFHGPANGQSSFSRSVRVSSK